MPEAPRDWVQEFLATDKRDRALAAEAEKKNSVKTLIDNNIYIDKMKGLPDALGPDFQTGLTAASWLAIRQNLTLAAALAAHTRDMHGQMNPALRPDAAQKIYVVAPATKAFAEAEMTLNASKVLYSKFHSKGMNDGDIARNA